MMTSGMHRRPFEGRHLVLYWIFGQKSKFFQKNSEARIAMCYISINLSQRALETNDKLFTNFGIIFRINYNFLKYYWCWLYASDVGEAFVLNSACSSFNCS